MDDLYPEPPHLTIAVYSDIDEMRCFATMCEVAEAADCTPSGILEVAPWDVEFEDRSDLAGRLARLDGVPAYRSTMTGDRSLGRPVRAGFRHRRHGIVVVEYLYARAGDRHPVAVSLGAGPLGLPIELWRKPERAAAERLAAWSVDILRDAASRCRAAFGGIGVEFTLGTPRSLVDGASLLASESYVSRVVLDSDDELRRALRSDFGDAEQIWDDGEFYSGWAPFNTGRTTLDEIPRRFRSSSRALGRAMQSGRS